MKVFVRSLVVAMLVAGIKRAYRNQCIVGLRICSQRLLIGSFDALLVVFRKSDLCLGKISPNRIYCHHTIGIFVGFFLITTDYAWCLQVELHHALERVEVPWIQSESGIAFFFHGTSETHPLEGSGTVAL